METKTFKGMRYRRAGKSGLWVSEIGLGLWKWGDPSYDGSRVGEHDGFRILDRALELGVVHWDTANSYNMGSGNSERLLGRYFQSRGSRSRDMVVLATKVRNSVRVEHVMEGDASPNDSGASRKYIIQAVEGCLRRLRTDRIDILYHHAPSLTEDGSWETPLDETWAAFDQLVTQGKVLYLAVSNRTVRQMEQEIDALTGVALNTSHRIIAVQNQYNVLQRGQVSSKDGELSLDDEREFLEFIGKQEIGLVPYLPLAVGLLTGRYRRGSLDQDGRLSERAGEWFRDELLTDRNLDLVERLIEIAKRKECSLAQLSIAWLLSHPEVCSVIAGVTRMEHLEDNAAACSVALAQQEIDEIDKLTEST